MILSASARLSKPGADLTTERLGARRRASERVRSTTMSSIFRIAALGAITLLPAHAGAEQLAPGSLDIVHLGSVSAMTYYTAEQAGFRAVTTIQPHCHDTPPPLRSFAPPQPPPETT